MTIPRRYSPPHSPTTPSALRSAVLAEDPDDDHDDHGRYSYAIVIDPKFAIDRTLPHHGLPSVSLHKSPGPALFRPVITTRSLTISTCSSESSDSMATTASSPTSPPQLSSSRSSTKSSSPHSSSLHGEIVSDFSHFEDISLADVGRDTSPREIRHTPRPPRPLLRPAQSGPTPRTTKSTSNLRDALRTSVTLNNHVRSVQGHRSPPGMRPGASPSSTPSLAPPTRPSRRGTSPNRPPPPSQRSATSPRLPRTQSDLSPVLHRPRRFSANTRRKTAAELEAEFTDSDDELPEDAYITNIPISPRPVSTPTLSVSPERSDSELPVRPNSDNFLVGRTRSWDAALFDLSSEVRDLTYKLESHSHANSRRNSDEVVSSTASSPRHSMGQRSKTTPVLPPVQRGDIMIDPLPISKEKEKHLTRTRPAWLPPKCQKEEKRHLKEYQQMMHSFIEAEKRRAADSGHKAPNTDSAMKRWRQVLGDWDDSVRSPEMRDLWWAGVPPALRGQVWARVIGNQLHLSAVSFRAALRRAQETASRLASTPRIQGHARQASTAESKGDTRARKSLAAIDHDIATGAFPSLGLFQAGKPRHDALRDLLLAYAAYREDIGHVQGTASIAALLLLQHMPTQAAAAMNGDSSEPAVEVAEDAATAGAFIALANLLNRPLSLAFCINDPAAKDRTYRHIMKATKHKLPRLHEHLNKLIEESSQQQTRLTMNDILGPMCQSLLTSHLRPEDCSRVWDVLMFEGDGVTVRAAVAVLAKLEGQLYCSAEEIKGILGWGRSEPARMGGEGKTVEWVRWAGREGAAPPS